MIAKGQQQFCSILDTTVVAPLNQMLHKRDFMWGHGGELLREWADTP